MHQRKKGLIFLDNFFLIFHRSHERAKHSPLVIVWVCVFVDICVWWCRFVCFYMCDKVCGESILFIVRVSCHVGVGHYSHGHKILSICV